MHTIAALKRSFREYCLTHKYPYRLLAGWFHRNTNRALREARRRGIDGNRVVFSSYNMRAYNDNPYYICEALRAMRPGTELVWLFKDVAEARARFDIPEDVRCVGWGTPEGIDALGRARVIVDNWQKYDWLRLGRQQVYLFSPHHDRSFKHGLFTRKDRLYNRAVEAHATMATTGSDFNRRFLRKAYHFKGPFIDVGLPRNDILVRDDPADAARIRKRLGVEDGARLLLYAPTFRDADTRRGAQQAVPLDLGHILDVLEQTTGARWLCLYRAHYLSLGLALDGAGGGRLVDVTRYPEMAELLRVADALISDYSCCAGDFLLRGKPVWLYVADVDDYAAHSRALCVNPLDTPYWCARTPEALDALIRRTTPEAAAANCREVLDFYGAHETGNAAVAAAAYICSKLDMN